MHGGAGRREDGQRGGGDRGAGPAAAATARSAARRQRGQSSTCRTSSRRRAALSSSWLSPVSRATVGQPPGLDDGERGAGALDLAGGGGQQFAGGGGLQAEHGGDLGGGELVADGQLQRLALLGGGAGGLRPGQQGEFAAPQLARLRGQRRVGRRVAVGGPAGVRGGGRRGRPAPLPAGAGRGRAGRPSGPGRTARPGDRRGLRVAPAAPFGEARTSPSAAVAASWSHSTERQ